MRQEVKRDLPIWTDDELSRLLGASAGYNHSISAVHMMIGRFYSNHINPRHVRKIAQRDAITKPLRELKDRLEDDLRRCQETYRREHSRAHPQQDQPR